MKNMSQISNTYIAFISFLLLILSAPVLYVIFIFPTIKLVSLFVQHNVWQNYMFIISVFIFFLFISCCVCFLTKARHLITDSTDMQENWKMQRITVMRYINKCGEIHGMIQSHQRKEMLNCIKKVNCKE